MKKLIIVLICTILAIPLALAAFSYSTWVSNMSCPNECIEGRYITFDIGVKNYGTSSFVIEYVEIRDRDNTDFAWKSATKALAPDEQIVIEGVEGYLPPPTSGSTLYYKICLYIKEEHWYGDTYDWYCSSERDMQVTPAGDVDCDYDWECSETQECTNHKCIPISCGYCEYISNHQCLRYACCADTDCLSDEKCVGHVCEEIWCPCGYIQDHKCINYECCYDYDCPENHYCSNHQCLAYECTQDSDCNYDQSCSFDYKCLSVTCDPTTQYVADHKCNDYECTNSWACNYDEYCSNHECTKLQCSFGYPSNHSCTSYWPITIAILCLLAAIIIAVIVRLHNKRLKHLKKKGNK